MRDATRSRRLLSLRLGMASLLYYSSIYLVKSSMFACSWNGMPTVLGLNYKTCLALAQTFGYAVGKVPALLVAPKLRASRLRIALLGVILGSGTCILLTPGEFKAAPGRRSCVASPVSSLLLVGLACVWLAPAWSLLQRYMEGRQDTEAIVALVSFSYIGAAGLCKGAASDLVAHGVTDTAAVGACAGLGVALGAAAALIVAAQPRPSAADVEKRGQRKEMSSLRAEGGRLMKRYGRGIVPIVLAYTLLGALRAYRDYFQLELFRAVGLTGSVSSLFALSEFLVSIVVLSSTAAFSLVEDNRRAVDVILRVSTAGGLGLTMLTLGHQNGHIGGLEWVIGVGACNFLAYVPLGTMLFDRLLAAAHEDMTSSLLSLVMDASVLGGTASLLCWKDFVQTEPDDAAHMHTFFCTACVYGGLAVAALLLASNVVIGRAVDRSRQVRGSKLDGNAMPL